MTTMTAVETRTSQPVAISQAQPMRAALRTEYGSTQVVRTGELPRPSPGPGEVLLQVHAAALDRGVWHLVTGRPYLMRLMGFGFRAPRQPVLGLDVAGTVVELGEGVTRFKVGDRVFGLGKGTFAEFACASEQKLTLVPAGMSSEEAATLGVSGITALDALTEHARTQPGERVLIIGASGGVGVFAVQVARALGAHVTAVCSGAKAARVAELGAERVLDYRTVDFTAGPEKYDVILDIAGATPVKRLRRVLADNGRLVFVGAENVSDWTGGFGRQLGALALTPWVKQRFVMLIAREHHEPLEELVKLYAQGKLRAVIDRRVGLDGVRAALEDMEASRLVGKVVVVP